MTDIETGFGGNMRRLRQRKGLSLQQLSAALFEAGLKQGSGSSYQNLSAIERGTASLSPSLARAIDDLLEAQGRLLDQLRVDRIPAFDPIGGIQLQAHLFYPLAVNCSHYPDLVATRFADPEAIQPLGLLRSTHQTRRTIFFPFNVVVVHEVIDLTMESLTDACVWRQKQVENFTGTVEAHLKAETGVAPIVHDRDPYCFTCFEVIALPWTDIRRRKALELLAIPSELGRAGLNSRSAGLSLETKRLADPSRHPELANFGGEDWGGFASWSAVAFEASPHDGLLSRDFVELEIQLQALWCYCNNMHMSHDIEAGAHQIADLRQALTALSKPRATEHVSRRLLRESLLRTSRITDMVAAVLEQPIRGSDR